MTGRTLWLASMPGRCAAPPAPAMITFNPRRAAVRPYRDMSIGVRCADTTRVSNGTSNSLQTSAAGWSVGQSESLPITMPTSGEVPLLMVATPAYRKEVARHHAHVPASAGESARASAGDSTVSRPARGVTVAEAERVRRLARASHRLLDRFAQRRDMTHLA